MGDVQTKWLKANLPTVFTSDLLEQVGCTTAALAIFLASQGYGQFPTPCARNDTQVKKIQVEVTDPSHAFPVRAGSHLTSEELGSPALALVRSLCAFMSLDACVADQVLLMRRQLLRLVHAREFSADSEFRVGGHVWN